ncbi:MAG: hypothetical protein HRF46_11700 [Acidobacteriota bacterium]|jgi:hypothetical protein
MAKPDYIICLECESEVDEFTWRDGEIRRAACDVCGNNDPDAFALPEDFEQDFEDDEGDEDEEEYLDDLEEDEDEEE